jgi:hypothetical protein
MKKMTLMERLREKQKLKPPQKGGKPKKIKYDPDMIGGPGTPGAKKKRKT